MTKELLIRGLPQRLRSEGWWLDPASSDGRAEDTPPSGRLGRKASRAGAILLLVVMADLLFWNHAPGISLALFAAAIFALATWRLRPWRELVRPWALLVVAALPVVDHLQALSVAFLGAGLVAALSWAHYPALSATGLAQATLQGLSRLPMGWLRLLAPHRVGRLLGQLRGKTTAAPAWGPLLRNWAFPIGGSLIFAALLLDANPVLARFFHIEHVPQPNLGRFLFWIGAAIFVTPFLAAMSAPQDRSPRDAPAAAPRLGINPGSVLRGLVLFNLLIGIQSLTDLSILIGGAELPAGMTMAQYAHRGAYPLFATAILAGLFAMAARPFLAEHRLIRPLMLLWLAQNMVLCGAAALRLDLYIQAFGLTYLRLHAMIWMALVAVGLGLALWQVLRGRDNGWLVRRCAVLALATLYLCCFVNFAQIIAAQNMTRINPDLDYLCKLGPSAIEPVVKRGIGTMHPDQLYLGQCSIPMPTAQNWRAWGFRSWSINRYLDRMTSTEPS